MSRFNSPITGPTLTTNLAGGDAHKQSAELQLISLLITSFAQDGFYKTADQTFADLRILIGIVDPIFAAKALIYARSIFGMRSITHAGASMLAVKAAGTSWGKSFYDKVVYRLDDMTEILSYHFAQKQKLTKAMQKGFQRVFDRTKHYDLAKYKSDNKAFKLVDVVNIVHPTPIEGNAMALSDLIKGKLKNTDTWEAKASAAGQKKSKDMAKVWKELLETKKLGYMALLRNLRNILQQSPEAVPLAVAALTDEGFIRKSLIMPFDYQKALEELEKLGSTAATRIVITAINKAVDISVSNVPKLKGETLVVLDTSQSMVQNRVDKKGGLFAAILAKANNADFMTFDTDARYQTLNHANSTIGVAQTIQYRGTSTDFRSIFNAANKKYDNIIILSDMQAWVGLHTPRLIFDSYRRVFNADPNIYSFDLAGLGTIQFPEKKVFALAGFSDKVFTVMALLQNDPRALVNEVKAIQL